MPRNTTKEPSPVEPSGSEGEEDEEEEYEIEAVLDAKKGVFPDGRIGYLVKWKNYGVEHNSWVNEDDAVNAKDLVDEYWRKNPHKSRSRKSTSKKSPPKKQAINVDSDSDTAATKKKRGRKSSSKPESDDDMDVDQPVKKKKNSRTSKARSPTPEDEDSGTALRTMEAYMGQVDWSHLVKSVDTVERDDEDGNLYIYFTLNTGEAVREKSKICKERFPQKLLDFYEDNLRWRSAQEVD